MDRSYDCSFCGKTLKEVKQMVVGEHDPDVALCNECAAKTPATRDEGTRDGG